ncbi:hypothetical protein CC1G_10424 [Coprinopsis cinerea okayama7|uniref:Uncharacterized protein n=1 Tax=Coprinopsis cinerea (strain Okayama-7 / 130 / ATCC MYA-4618 / FGSC 9003) TaxID=240176 RepID=A8PAR8_COPC7|nr:hypothetical protein CC1G_10424 [Coprinopsis cinerea okayama7\|eukprot:XP_001840040.2 hypothetical protein CC1G_10424 [Coprinopsis cinerea okayama7\
MNRTLSSSLSQSPPHSPILPSQELDIDIVDLEELNFAIQIEARMDFWATWVGNIEEFRKEVNCGSPLCSVKCAPLETHMSCSACFYDPSRYPSNCGLRDLYLRDLLRSQAGLSPGQVERFMPAYKRFKQVALNETTPTSCLAGLDGNLFGLLSRARDELTDLRQSLAPIPHNSRSPLSKLEVTLAKARKENAQVACNSLRARLQWVTLSHLIEDLKNTAEDTSRDASLVLKDLVSRLERFSSLTLLFDSDEIQAADNFYDFL